MESEFFITAPPHPHPHWALTEEQLRPIVPRQQLLLATEDYCTQHTMVVLTGLSLGHASGLPPGPSNVTKVWAQEAKPNSWRLTIKRCRWSRRLSQMERGKPKFAISDVNDDLIEKIKAAVPEFMTPGSTSNMVTYVGRVIPGVTTIQLHCYSDGWKTPGHQAINNFCSININLGPGDCEWFAVPFAYWGAIHAMCLKKKIHYSNDSWWPTAEQLMAANIPVFHCRQKPGDLIFINSGAVHWRRSVGFCMHVSYHFAPFTLRQYSRAVERFEMNRRHGGPYCLSMVDLSWKLARDCHLTNAELFTSIRNYIWQSYITMEASRIILEASNKKIVYDERALEMVFQCPFCKMEKFYFVNACDNCDLYFTVSSQVVFERHPLQYYRHIFLNFQLWLGI